MKNIHCWLNIRVVSTWIHILVWIFKPIERSLMRENERMSKIFILSYVEFNADSKYVKINIGCI